jgi:hypothetical protein
MERLKKVMPKVFISMVIMLTHAFKSTQAMEPIAVGAKGGATLMNQTLTYEDAHHPYDGRWGWGIGGFVEWSLFE